MFEDSIKALECIDEIHEGQNLRLSRGMPMLKSELDNWSKINYVPC